MEEILKDLEDKKQKVTQKHKFEIGDRVKITDGVFVNFIGTVTEVFHDKGRLSVLVSFLVVIPVLMIWNSHRWKRLLKKQKALDRAVLFFS